jgi:hypothetical protein
MMHTHGAHEATAVIGKQQAAVNTKTSTYHDTKGET